MADREVLFIAGPADGRRLRVAKGAETFSVGVPAMLTRRGLGGPVSEVVPASAPVIYRRRYMQFEMENGQVKTLDFFAPDGIEHGDAIEWLLLNYRPTKAEGHG